jgi:hypothetical protein
MLLFWSKDVGCGIAAVRFQSPVLVHSVRIVPSGVAPFTAVATEVGCVARPIIVRLFACLWSVLFQGDSTRRHFVAHIF